MRSTFNKLLLLLFIAAWTSQSYAQSNCDAPVAQIFLDANNVRTSLLQGGSFWWDGSNGQYIFPNTQNGAAPVSALFAGGLWMGGIDPNGTIKTAGQTYGASTGSTDFWPGPLTPEGVTDNQTCSNWDRFFKINQVDIDAFKEDWEDNGVLDSPIPQSIKGWPAQGNPFFLDMHGFDLPNTTQGFAPYVDTNDDAVYNPTDGDYPQTKNATEAIWWVFNDVGNEHAETGSAGKLHVEIQMMAYAYASTIDAVNNTTFYDIKAIYRGTEELNSSYLSLWVDPDLGCYTDDYVGCVPAEGMSIFYNEDAVDGTTSCSCEAGIATYCEEIPMMAIKVLGDGLSGYPDNTGFSSFLSYENGAVGNPSPSHTDPSIASEYYNLMTGHWKDGSAVLDPDGNETLFQFPDAPDDVDGWSMCTNENSPLRDSRILMNFGPFSWQPGGIRRMTFAVIGVENVEYPCPSLTPIMDAVDDIENFLEDITATDEVYLAKTAVTFSPNPVTGQSILAVKEGIEINNITIYNAEGKVVRSVQNLNTPTYIFDKKNLSSGMYVYKFITNDGRVASGKFIIQE